MPQQAWTRKQERQYEHIKTGQQQEGRSEDTAEEVAARTVNKQRARAGESRQHSRASTQDISAHRRGGNAPATVLEGAPSSSCTRKPSEPASAGVRA